MQKLYAMWSINYFYYWQTSVLKRHKRQTDHAPFQSVNSSTQYSGSVTAALSCACSSQSVSNRNKLSYRFRLQKKGRNYSWATGIINQSVAYKSVGSISVLLRWLFSIPPHTAAPQQSLSTCRSHRPLQPQSSSHQKRLFLNHLCFPWQGRSARWWK